MDEAQQGRVGFGRAYGGPGKYIQRPGEIDRLAAHLKSVGDKASPSWRSAAPFSVPIVRDATLALDAFTSSLATSS